MQAPPQWDPTGGLASSNSLNIFLNPFLFLFSTLWRAFACARVAAAVEGATGGGGQAGGGDCCEATGGGRGEAEEGAEEGAIRQVAAEREGRLGVGRSSSRCFTLLHALKLCSISGCLDKGVKPKPFTGSLFFLRLTLKLLQIVCEATC